MTPVLDSLYKSYAIPPSHSGGLKHLGRNIDSAAQDAQKAINAAVGTLPGNIPTLPIYSKVNPAQN